MPDWSRCSTRSTPQGLDASAQARAAEPCVRWQTVVAAALAQTPACQALGRCSAGATQGDRVSQAQAENHLIELLPLPDRRRLLALAEPVELVLSEVLAQPDQPTHHVYFPTNAFISLVTLIDGHPGLEVGMVGREGMLGTHLVLGVHNEPLRALVQGAGRAWRVDATPFGAELARSEALRRVMLRYLFVRMAQLAAAAACLRYHLIGPRLARWLLMSQDRAHAAQFHVTHEFLAYMLGVRRVGVTMAASGLQRAGLIAYHRGEMTVVDRCGLEAMACGCYAADCQAYADLMDRA